MLYLNSIYIVHVLRILHRVAVLDEVKRMEQQEEYVPMPLYRVCHCGETYNAQADTDTGNYKKECNDCSQRKEAQ